VRKWFGVPENPRWDEIFEKSGAPRPIYARLMEYLQGFRPPELRTLDDRMEATLREMGVTLDIIRKDPWGQQAWACDLLPQVFAAQEWDRIVLGVRQRLEAFELFLADVYGKKEILRQNVIPIASVLGSPQYQNACIGLPRAQGAFLHLSGVCLIRDKRGRFMVRHHHFGHAPGISYMMQNRRALARVTPDIFQESAVQSLAQTPQAITEKLRYTVERAIDEPSVVLLSGGPGSPIYSEHTFLARRMGVPLVQGDDLLVLNDRLYLKTVQGLRRVEVVYTRVADDWLDPLVFRKDSRLGVPGLVHCLRQGTVAIFNSIGSQLADDRSLLGFAPQIIRYYLAEDPILPTVPTYWLGDLDQREMVLENLDAYEIKPIFARFLGATEQRVREEEMKAIRKEPSRYIAQPAECGAKTVCFKNGKQVEGVQDHIVFALRAGDAFDVFPGALTRVFPGRESTNAFPLGWTSKDTWVVGDSEGVLTGSARRHSDAHLPPRQVTSRVAESFYWMGRYLERAYHQAYLIQVIETLETEELNSAERKLYRPLWNRLLPPLEKSAGAGKRSIGNRADRYRLVLLPEPGSILSTFRRALRNAESIQECLSPEAWSTLNDLRSRFERSKYRKDLPEIECGRVARRLSETATRLIPQFSATASRTMLADDGWRFCEIAEMLERAIITANAVLSIAKSFEGVQLEENSRVHAIEIELSAFLRLLGTRDAYRRIYQMRAEPIRVLEMLWQNSEAPRSVLRCLQRCAALVRESPESASVAGTLAAIEELLHKIKRVDWPDFVSRSVEEDLPRSDAEQDAPRAGTLAPLLGSLLGALNDLHHVISDGFLSHQAYISNGVQTVLKGFDI